MKQYYAVTLPQQVIPGSNEWEVHIIYKDDITGIYSSERKVSKGIEGVSEIRMRLLKQGVQNMH